MTDAGFAATSGLQLVGREKRGIHTHHFKARVPQCYISLPLAFHWREFGHRATLNHKRGREIWSSYMPRKEGRWIWQGDWQNLPHKALKVSNYFSYSPWPPPKKITPSLTCLLVPKNQPFKGHLWVLKALWSSRNLFCMCVQFLKYLCVCFVISFWLDPVLVVACGVFAVAHALSSWGAWALWLRSVGSVVATRA